MKKLFLIFAVLFFVPGIMAQNGVTISGTYFKGDDSNVNFWGGKLAYLVQTNTNIFWGIFAEGEWGTQKYQTVQLVTNYFGTSYQNVEKSVTTSLLKLGGEFDIFPGASNTIFIGAEFFYVSASTEGIKSDGYGGAPKIGLMFPGKDARFFVELKYNFLQFSDEDQQTKGLGLEAGILF